MRYRHPCMLLKRFLWVAVPLLAPGLGQAQVALRKSCGDGITLKLNAATVTQGSLLLGEVASTKGLPAITAEWDGRTIPVWREGKNPASLHALLGVDLEKAPGRYEWKISWDGADGKPKECSAPVTVRVGKFTTERL